MSTGQKKKSKSNGDDVVSHGRFLLEDEQSYEAKCDRIILFANISHLCLAALFNHRFSAASWLLVLCFSWSRACSGWVWVPRHTSVFSAQQTEIPTKVPKRLF